MNRVEKLSLAHSKKGGGKHNQDKSTDKCAASVAGDIVQAMR